MSVYFGMNLSDFPSSHEVSGAHDRHRGGTGGDKQGKGKRGKRKGPSKAKLAGTKKRAAKK